MGERDRVSPNLPRNYTVPEARRLLGMSRRELVSLLERNILRGWRDLGLNPPGWRISETDLEQFQHGGFRRDADLPRRKRIVTGKQMIEVDGYLVKSLKKKINWDEYSNVEYFNLTGASRVLGRTQPTVLKYIVYGLLEAHTYTNSRGTYTEYTISKGALKEFAGKVSRT